VTPKPTVLGVVTARAGSKGIPGKNTRRLAGKPLIAYTIESALASGAFDRLILSTDDEEAARIAKDLGCEVPFLRPAALSADDTPHLPVMQHAVDWMRDEQHYQAEWVMILMPTSPLRQPSHIVESVNLAVRSGADSVVSVDEIASFATEGLVQDPMTLKAINGVSGIDYDHADREKDGLPVFPIHIAAGGRGHFPPGQQFNRNGSPISANLSQTLPGQQSGPNIPPDVARSLGRRADAGVVPGLLTGGPDTVVAAGPPAHRRAPCAAQPAPPAARAAAWPEPEAAARHRWGRRPAAGHGGQGTGWPR
jgi:CMP-N-acetylneuraminic acid synthetase